MLDYIKGMDISSLDEIEKLGAKFYDHGGEGGEGRREGVCQR